MAERRTKESNDNTSLRKRQVAAFAGLLVSFMLLLSIISYSTEDQRISDLGLRDLWRAFTNDAAMRETAAKTSNLLGILGALISNWFINSTIGYAIIILPLLGIGWSYVILRNADRRALTIATIYIASYAGLFSIICGVIHAATAGSAFSSEWSGVIGTFLAEGLVTLMGVTGASVALVGIFIVLTVVAIDIDVTELLRKIGEFLSASGLLLKRFWEWIVDTLKRSEEKLLKTKVIQKKTTVEIKRSPDELAEKVGQRKEILKEYPPAVKEVETEPELVKDRTDEGELTPSTKKKLSVAIKERKEEEEVDFDEQVVEEGIEEIDYVTPSVELLDTARGAETVDEEELKENAELLRAKLGDFDVQIESVSVTPGPVVTLYELVPSTGVKISRIQSLEDDIALALKAKGIRIIAPMPGKGTVGVEIPNHNPTLVTIRSIINSAKFRDYKGALPLAIGKTISGEAFVDDLSKMPHILIAGATGSGKSVGINTIITSFLYRLHPSDIKLIIIDPKKIELSLYAKLRNHYLAVSPDIDEEIVTTPENSVLILKSAELEMERRYERLAAAGVRSITDYNERLKSGRLHDTETVKHRKMPYLIIIIDELADLMITAAREVEEPIARLAQLARAVGIHLVLATQRPSVDVITGVIKANFPARIAYQVASKIDSRTILDMNGAEQLLGNGDMLYLPSGSPKPMRIQNAFISTEEVERIVDHIEKQKGYKSPYQMPSALERKRSNGRIGDVGRDELFEEAAQIIVRHQQGSVSLLQRRLKVGYSRAARLIDELEDAGIVGPFDGSKARQVLVDTEEQLQRIFESLGL